MRAPPSLAQYVSAGSSGSIIGAAADFDKTFKCTHCPSPGTDRSAPHPFHPSRARAADCGNASYSYDYSAEYQYGSPPKCRELSTGEATVKDTKNFFFVTMVRMMPLRS